MHTTFLPLAAWGHSLRTEIEHDRGLFAALLAVAVALFAIFVMVLEQDVHRAQRLHADALAHGVAVAACYTARDIDLRAQCLTRLQGPPAVEKQPPANDRVADSRRVTAAAAAPAGME
jgi:hypothetical protein